MGFVVNTLEQSFDFARSLGRALLPTRDWSPLGMGGKWARWFAGVVTDLHAHVDSIKDDLLPDTASGTALDRWGKIRGVTRKAATPARKSNALRVQGTSGTAITIGLVLTSKGGLTFQVNEAETIPAAGNVAVDIVAISTGAQTRLPKGEVLTFSAPPAGIEEEAELILAMDEDGVDAESDGDYRNRILEKFSSPPLGGAQSDYVQWAKEVTGIATAYAYPLRQGFNSVDLAALHSGSGSARLLTAGENTSLDTYVRAKKPAGVTLRVLTVQATDVDVELLVTPTGEAAYEFDWVDSTPLVVSAWAAATRILTFTTDRPASMKAGHRLTIKPTAGGGDGKQHVIESLSGANAVVLKEAPALAPAATDTVYSGGPLVDTLRNAIIAHIDALGTSNTDAAPYLGWEANLRPANLYKIAQLTTGVKKSNVTAPTATVEPADNPYPSDATVFVLVPRRILVRKG